MQEHEKFIKEALKLAGENVLSGQGGPFGAVIVKNGTIIGRGINQVTSLNDPTAHAEIMAIRDACNHLQDFQLNDCIIYSSCEPCPMCLGAIYWARPRMIVYAAQNTDAAIAGFDDSYIYRELNLPEMERKIPTLNIKPDNFFTPFQLWMDHEKKKPY